MKKSNAFIFKLFLILTACGSLPAFANTPSAQTLGSGAYFYAWNANEYCSTDTTINSTGRCPEKWTDIIKNINAQVPDGASRAKIKFIYLDSVTLQNLTNTDTNYTVGGCGSSANIVFCSTSAGLTYVPNADQQVDGPAAVQKLSQELGQGYYIIPMVSDSGDQSGINSLDSTHLTLLANALATLVTNNPNVSGLAFDIEDPDMSSHKNTDPNSASDFYTALQTAIGSDNPPKFIMVSRDPNGLNESQSEPFGTTLNRLNQSNPSTTFIFSPQTYDLCDGMGTWACPLALPYTPPGVSTPTYAQSNFFQPIPSDTADGNGWDSNDILFSKFATSYQFLNQLSGHSLPTPNLYPNVPVQPSISAGGSSQIWAQVNLYNVNSATDPFILGVSPYSNAPISFQPSMIYANKKPCQAENPDGTLGATIPNCVAYPNPYGETIAAYMDTFFTSLQYDLIGNNSTSSFSGVTLYPFSPYGFFDKKSGSKANYQGYFPEAPDGLVNGQKPQTSFWEMYLNQFANQWISSPNGTPPSQTAPTTPELFLTLQSNYYQLNGTTATVSFGTTSYPLGGTFSNIAAYQANLLDAVGTVVASGSCSSNNCTTIHLNNLPGGNYVLQLEALDSNNHVIASTEAAVSNGGVPPAPTITISNLQVSGTPTTTSYTLSWTLNCTIPPTSGFLAVSQLYAQGSSSPLSRLSQWVASATCGQTYQSTFSITHGQLPVSATQAEFVLEQAGTFQYITSSSFVPISIPASASSTSLTIKK